MFNAGHRGSRVVRRCTEHVCASLRRCGAVATGDKVIGHAPYWLPRFIATQSVRAQDNHNEELTHGIKACAVSAEKTSVDVSSYSGEVQSQQAASPYCPQHNSVFSRRRGNFTPEFYVSPNALGYADPVAETLSAGRTDPEWAWLKLLCFICTISTLGTAVYAFFFPEHVKVFKDEPWSAFRN